MPFDITALPLTPKIYLHDVQLLGQTQHGVYDEVENLDPILLHCYYGAASSQMSNHSGSNISNSDDSDSNPPGPESEDESTSTPSPQPTSNPDSDSDSDSDSGSGSGSGSNLDSSSNSNPNSGSDNDDDDAAGVEKGQVVSWQEITETISNAQRCNIHHDAAEVAKAAVPFENGEEAHAFALALDDVLSSSSYPAGFRPNEEYESLESYRTGRSTKPLIIPLPYDVWFPCIVVWCKALDLLKRLSICKVVATEL